MRIVLGLVLSVLVSGAVAPAFAFDENVVNCSNAPRSQWAKCIIDQSQEQTSQ